MRELTAEEKRLSLIGATAVEDKKVDFEPTLEDRINAIGGDAAKTLKNYCERLEEMALSDLEKISLKNRAVEFAERRLKAVKEERVNLQRKGWSGRRIKRHLNRKYGT